MKHLFLLRHAKSEWGDSSLADIDRPLNDRGRAAAAAMGEEIRRLGLTFDLVIASPARRVRETLAGAGFESDRTEPAIYNASVETLLGLARASPDSAGSVLIAGHFPGLPGLALTLTEGRDDPLRKAVATKYPTAALAEIELESDRWADVGGGSGRLVRFVRPRDL